jgi:hypothetical protein
MSPLGLTEESVKTAAPPRGGRAERGVLTESSASRILEREMTRVAHKAGRRGVVDAVGLDVRGLLSAWV